MIGGIAAGIVVFNAEKERLENNISRLKKQVKDVYIFDNSNVSDGDYDGVTYLSENKHRLTRAHREKQLKMSCQALHNAPPNRT